VTLAATGVLAVSALAGQAWAANGHVNKPVGSCPSDKWELVDEDDPDLLGQGPGIDFNGNDLVCLKSVGQDGINAIDDMAGQKS
jgi:hypothetical protein